MESLAAERGEGLPATEIRQDRAEFARAIVCDLGGRYSAELKIDVDAGEAEVERWFLAATLFGTRIFASVAERAFRALDVVGLTSISQVRQLPGEELVALLDAGGYAHYDFRMAERLTALAQLIDERYAGRVSMIGRTHHSYPALRSAVLALPGWGPVTAELFLRELRGVWDGAQPPLDPRALRGGRHLGLLDVREAEADAVAEVARLAESCGLDARDLESALVRLTLAHRRLLADCPGGRACLALHRDRHRTA
jgi:endonuclease III